MSSLRQQRRKPQPCLRTFALGCRQIGGYLRDLRSWYKSSLRRLFFRFTWQPVALELGEMSERLETSHSIQIHLAHQVVKLVLNDTREEILRDELDLVPMTDR